MDNKVIKASRVAWYYHRNQLRKGREEPYFFHCARVSALVSSFEDSTEDMVIAAWLHDTVEDTSINISYIDKVFGSNVLNIVLELTNKFTKNNYPNLNREERKKREAERLSKCSKEARVIKLCDRLDNISDMDYVKTKKYYLDETRDLVDAIGDASSTIANDILERLDEYILPV